MNRILGISVSLLALTTIVFPAYAETLMTNPFLRADWNTLDDFRTYLGHTPVSHMPNDYRPTCQTCSPFIDAPLHAPFSGTAVRVVSGCSNAVFVDGELYPGYCPHDDDGYGNYIRLTAEDETTVLMAHLSFVSVSEGEIVIGQEPIAGYGASGYVVASYTDGRHLHLEYRDSTGTYQNPDSYFCSPQVFPNEGSTSCNGSSGYCGDGDCQTNDGENETTCQIDCACETVYQQNFDDPNLIADVWGSQVFADGTSYTTFDSLNYVGAGTGYPGGQGYSLNIYIREEGSVQEDIVLEFPAPASATDSIRVSFRYYSAIPISGSYISLQRDPATPTSAVITNTLNDWGYAEFVLPPTISSTNVMRMLLGQLPDHSSGFDFRIDELVIDSCP